MNSSADSSTKGTVFPKARQHACTCAPGPRRHRVGGPSGKDAQRDGWTRGIAPGGADFWGRVQHAPADLLVVSRVLLPSPASDSVRILRDLPDQPAVVVIWGHEDPEERASLLAAGCYAVLYSGLADESLRETFVSLLDRREQEINEQVQTEVDQREAHLRDFDTRSPVMQAFIRMVRRVVHADSSLLILGETGVGKERLARAIHEASPRGDSPFVPVNCACLPRIVARR